jgi:integrase
VVHRSNPIPETLEPVPGFGTLCIYKTPSSSFYQARCYMGRIVKRTLKTDKRSVAMEAAKEFYHDCLLKKRKREPITFSGTFKKVVGDLLETDRARVARGERKESLIRDGEYITDKLIEFFNKHHVRTIDFQRIQEYVREMEAKKPRPSAATIKNHLVWLHKVLTHAVMMKLAESVPVFPKIQRKDNPRPWLTDQQYTNLLEACTAVVGTIPEKTYRPITKELRLLTAFLVNTFLRPPDLKNMRHEDVTLAEHERIKVLKIYAQSKVESSTVVSRPLAVTVYDRLSKLHKDMGYGDSQDFIFFPELKDRGYAFQCLRLQFNAALTKANLKKDSRGKPRTLYSLRHSAIMFRLLNAGKLDYATFSTNCRTSIPMLERFYLSHLKAEMNMEGMVRQGPGPGSQT